jgi:hypothetical protein
MDAVPVPFVMRLADRGPLAVPATKSAEREVLRLLRRGGEPRLRELSVRSVRSPRAVNCSSASGRPISLHSAGVRWTRRPRSGCGGQALCRWLASTTTQPLWCLIASVQHPSGLVARS